MAIVAPAAAPATSGSAEDAARTSPATTVEGRSIEAPKDEGKSGLGATGRPPGFDPQSTATPQGGNGRLSDATGLAGPCASFRKPRRRVSVVASATNDETSEEATRADRSSFVRRGVLDQALRACVGPCAFEGSTTIDGGSEARWRIDDRVRLRSKAIALRLQERAKCSLKRAHPVATSSWDRRRCAQRCHPLERVASSPFGSIAMPEDASNSRLTQVDADRVDRLRAALGVRRIDGDELFRASGVAARYAHAGRSPTVVPT